MRECDRQGRPLRNQPVSSGQGEQSGNVKIGQGIRGYFRTKCSSELNLSCFISGMEQILLASVFFLHVINICMPKHRQKDIDINNTKGEKGNKSRIKTSFSGGLPLKMKGR